MLPGKELGQPKKFLSRHYQKQAVESVKRILNKLLSAEAGSNNRKPLQEAEATLAEQLSTIRQLFQPDAHEQRVEQQPSDTWPRGQQLQPLQQHQLLLQTPPSGIAPALPLHTALHASGPNFALC